PARAGSVHFPDARRVFAPADRPDEVLLTTNVGLVTSEDGGRTWTWSCQQEIPSQGTIYVQGPAPRHRLLALADTLMYSDDAGCNWQASMVTAIAVSNYLLSIDAAGGDRALAVAGIPIGDGATSFAVLASSNGGATFDAVR